MVRPYATRPVSRTPKEAPRPIRGQYPGHVMDQSEASTKRRSVTDPGLLNRTAWTNAAVALDHIKKVRGHGFYLSTVNRNISVVTTVILIPNQWRIKAV